MNIEPINSPFRSIKSFSFAFPEFSYGGVKWLIFNNRSELLERGVIRYWGRKILIHEQNFFQYIMDCGTQKIGHNYLSK
jgi:hypothetical protein